MTNITQLTEEEFASAYSLVENHLNQNSGWTGADGRSCLFESYGEQFDFVRRQDPARIWTIIDSDEGDWCIVSGLRLVNRVGYLISHKPVQDNVVIEVRIPLST